MKSNLYPEISKFIAQSVEIEMEKAISASNLTVKHMAEVPRLRPNDYSALKVNK